MAFINWHWHMLHTRLGACSQFLLHDIIEGKVLGKATGGRKTMELLHDMMGGRDYGQLKDLISDISRWRQDNK